MSVEPEPEPDQRATPGLTDQNRPAVFLIGPVIIRCWGEVGYESVTNQWDPKKKRYEQVKYASMSAVRGA